MQTRSSRLRGNHGVCHIRLIIRRVNCSLSEKNNFTFYKKEYDEPVFDSSFSRNEEKVNRESFRPLNHYIAVYSPNDLY